MQGKLNELYSLFLCYIWTLFLNNPTCISEWYHGNENTSTLQNIYYKKCTCSLTMVPCVVLLGYSITVLTLPSYTKCFHKNILNIEVNALVKLKCDL